MRFTYAVSPRLRRAVSPRLPLVVPALALCVSLTIPLAAHAGPAPAGAPRHLSDAPAGEAAPSTTASALKLNEFLAGPARDWDGDGTVSTRDDEWIELVNTGAVALDLSSFYFTDGDSVPRFAFSGSIAPGGRRVVFGSESYAWEKATAHPAFGLSLGNTGDQVILWQVVGPESLVVDRFTYVSYEAAADRALGRVPDGTGDWALLDALNPYTGSLTPGPTGCAPTPGSANTCSATAARRVSWGGMKAIYR
jgi:hypothetical protein